MNLRRSDMPVITVTLGNLNTEQKREMIRRMTEVSMDISGAPEHAHAVLINELPDEALGLGTKTVADIKAGK